MFKKAKQKIIRSILAILSAVLLGTLCMVYLSSYLSVTSQNYKVLSEHVQKLADPKMSNPDIKNLDGLMKENRRDEKIARHLEVGTFYSVILAENGTAEVIENGAPELYSDEELIALAQKIETETKGKNGDLLYMVTKTDVKTIVCFMDNLVFSESFTQLLIFTLAFGVIAMMAIALISYRIAEKIVSPMEETYQKQKQFTADAGHELKSPVAAMSANIELLSREIGENKWLENIAYENARMHDLITELLDLAQNENKTIEKKRTDLSHLVNSVILPLEASAFEKNILIDSHIEENIFADIDEKGIGQLVTILMDNAISHTKCEQGENMTVQVSLSKSKDAAVFSVSNPGDEIPEDEREKLFERFYRSESSHEFTGHYGLGLAIAKAIAAANDAAITVSCQEGLVTFTVTF